MADKLEGLVSRLETAVGKLEQAHGGKLENLIASLEKSVSRLESIQGIEQGKVEKVGDNPKEISSTHPTLSKSSNIDSFTAFNPLYREWEEKAKCTENQDIIELVNLSLFLKSSLIRQIWLFTSFIGQMQLFLLLQLLKNLQTIHLEILASILEKRLKKLMINLFAQEKLKIMLKQ